MPLAKAYGEDTKKDHNVIWVNTYGKAKVFGTTMGHFNSTMEDPVYLDLIARLRDGKIRGIDTDAFIIVLEIRIKAYRAEIEYLEYVMPAPLMGF